MAQLRMAKARWREFIARAPYWPQPRNVNSLFGCVAALPALQQVGKMSSQAGVCRPNAQLEQRSTQMQRSRVPLVVLCAFQVQLAPPGRPEQDREVVPEKAHL